MRRSRIGATRLLGRWCRVVSLGLCCGILLRLRLGVFSWLLRAGFGVLVVGLFGWLLIRFVCMGIRRTRLRSLGRFGGRWSRLGLWWDGLSRRFGMLGRRGEGCWGTLLLWVGHLAGGGLALGAFSWGAAPDPANLIRGSAPHAG